jgi:signal peptidase I
MFQKAGVPQWKAYVPFYNTWVMQELARPPKTLGFLAGDTGSGLFITPGIFIEL